MRLYPAQARPRPSPGPAQGWGPGPTQAQPMPRLQPRPGQAQPRPMQRADKRSFDTAKPAPTSPDSNLLLVHLMHGPTLVYIYI